MATSKIETALGNLGDIGDFVGATPLTVIAATTTTLTLRDSDGDGFTFTGTGLSYGVGGVTGGTFTGLRIFSGAGATLETVSDFSVAAMPFFLIYQSGGISAGVLDLFKGNDSITGSTVGDKLFGYSGNDTIKGGGGSDIIVGSVGRDKLSGQGGADVFIFAVGDGKDTITDFTDTGGVSDDHIWLTRVGGVQALYRHMTVEETTTGVTLHFGVRGEISVLGWHAADVDITDFTLS